MTSLTVLRASVLKPFSCHLPSRTHPSRLTLPGVGTWLPQAQGLAATAAPGGNRPPPTPPVPPSPRPGPIPGGEGSPEPLGSGWEGPAGPTAGLGIGDAVGSTRRVLPSTGSAGALAGPPGSELATPSSPGQEDGGGLAGIKNPALSTPPGPGGAGLGSAPPAPSGNPVRSHLISGYRPKPSARLAWGLHDRWGHPGEQAHLGPPPAQPLHQRRLGGSFLQQVSMELPETDLSRASPER